MMQSMMQTNEDEDDQDANEERVTMKIMMVMKMSMNKRNSFLLMPHGWTKILQLRRSSEMERRWRRRGRWWRFHSSVVSRWRRRWRWRRCCRRWCKSALDERRRRRRPKGSSSSSNSSSGNKRSCCCGCWSDAERSRCNNKHLFLSFFLSSFLSSQN